MATAADCRVYLKITGSARKIYHFCATIAAELPHIKVESMHLKRGELVVSGLSVHIAKIKGEISDRHTTLRTHDDLSNGDPAKRELWHPLYSNKHDF